jgi:GT2 family glycosyltransferase
MVAQLLSLCGCHLGREEDLLPPTPDNPDGHWEHIRFVELNDGILHELGGGWDCPPKPPPSWAEGAALTRLRLEARAVLGEFQGREPWGWKDPRNSLTLPFWTNLVEGLKVVVCLRNPLEVALSLRRRGLCSYSLGLSLWRTYTERILAWARPEGWVVTHYGAYFPDPCPELRRVANLLGLAVTDERLQSAAAAAKTGLRHNRFTTQDLFDTGVAPDITRLYLDLCREAGWSEGSTSSAAGVDALGGEDRTGGPEVDRAAVESERLRRDLLSLQETLASRDAGMQETQALLEEARAKAQRDAEQIRSLEEKARLQATLERTVSAQAELAATVKSWQERVLCRLDDIEASLDALASLQVFEQGKGTAATNRLAYRQLVRRIREAVCSQVPPDATVLVVSRGDEDLLQLAPRQAWHFPQNEDGVYAGYYPHNGRAAIAHLECLRAEGGDFFVLPESSRWWLDKYPDFRNHLERRYRLLLRQEGTCVVFALRERPPDAALHDLLDECQAVFENDLSVLDWNSGGRLAARFPEYNIFSPPSSEGALPYLERSIDIVAVGSGEEAALAEARRVAREAVVLVPPGGENASARDVQVEWQSAAPSGGSAVTIIIVGTHGPSRTRACLRSVLENMPSRVRGEVLVVTREAGEQGMPPVADQAAGGNAEVTIIRAPPGEEVAAAAARAVSRATGELLIFLEDNSLPLIGWLLPLYRLFRDRPDAGVVGPMVVARDGAVAEAGGVLRDGFPVPLAQGDRGELEGWYDCLRETDYCSAACLATRRRLFSEVGGFDTGYQATVYAQVDYCLKARREGYKTYYQPESTVVLLSPSHGASGQVSGTQEVESARAKFLANWGDSLPHLPYTPPRGGERELPSLVRAGDGRAAES